MNASLHAARPRTLSAHSLLFARYVTGQIKESSWRQITRVFDAEVASHDERDAFASFISDAWNEVGPDSLDVPRLEEVEEMLTFTRTV